MAELDAEVKRLRESLKAMHRRAQAAEGEAARLRSQLEAKPVDTWSSPARQEEALERDAACAAIEAADTSEKCPMCEHSLAGNRHGFDQNDATMDGDKLVHGGRCTYCYTCNPRLLHYQQKSPSAS
jgi:hypothetical protein